MQNVSMSDAELLKFAIVDALNGSNLEFTA